ncbi:putative GNAT family acetyltransferase [Daldinia caldariorum]|uniref:putative GNAT family acetyltransferase n=1 Tax=Daldinia caldariorum TaxID=326644 RepID=UPI0020085FF8|nr:putative GNAT family acetyltransferase [Daldinia caldariorum]KAI1463059.1 putative GNAT family acetyltransferase [Daldinia caldariorum]
MSTCVLVQPVDSPDDFTQVYRCISEAFARQIQDTIWMSTNPNWDSPEGQKEGAAKLLRRWQSATKNKDGQPNTVILKATLPDPQDESKRKIVGAAIWSQLSFVDGHGDRPTDSPDLTTLPDTERRFASQMFRSLWKRRVALAREKASSDSPALFMLDTCAVDPAFQRRGVAGKLVEWGLEEAKRRGGLECATEASPMGRTVYKKLGFRAEGAGEDLIYEVDEEFRHRDKPAILFMRTGAS